MAMCLAQGHINRPVGYWHNAPNRSPQTPKIKIYPTNYSLENHITISKRNNKSIKWFTSKQNHEDRIGLGVRAIFSK